MQLIDPGLAPADQTMDVLQGKRLVFLVGASRSGTTWLQRLLTNSPEAASAFETHLFSGYLRSSLEKWQSWCEIDHVMGLHRLISAEEYFVSIRDCAASILAKVTKEKPDARFIIEKTPAHSAFAREILDMFPDAMFIHLVRDPRAVVSSLLAASRTWASDIKGISTAEACEIWTRSVEGSRAIRDMTPNYYEVKYEVVLAEGAKAFAEIANWVGLSLTADECKSIIERNAFDRMKAEGDSSGDAVGKLPDSFFRSGTTSAWKKDLSVAQVAMIENMAGPLMQQFGYVPETTGHLAKAEGAAMLAGAFLRQRVKWRLMRWGRRLWLT